MGFLLKMFAGNPVSMLWIGGGIFLAGLTIGGGGAWTVQGWRLDAANSKYDVFVAKTEALGKAQEAAAKVKDAENQSKMEKANAENARTKSALAIALNSVRNARPSSSFVPQAPAGAKRPDLICFDRAEYIRADGEFTAEARGLSDEGTTATVDLNTAKTWAQPK